MLSCFMRADVLAGEMWLLGTCSTFHSIPELGSEDGELGRRRTEFATFLSDWHVELGQLLISI